MKITTKGRYALIIMLNLAKEYKNDKFVSLKDISDKENISLKYLEKIMLNLNKTDYLISSRGKIGGYKLKYPPENYKISDILKKADENTNVTDCVTKECPNKKRCLTFPLWDDLNNLIQNYLDSKTLKDYIERN